MWALSPSDNNSQINAFKATYGQTFPAAGTQGGGPAAKNVVIAGQTFYGYPTYAVICPDRTIHFDICWPPTLSCLNSYISQCGPPQIEADFEADNPVPQIGQTVNFTDLSTENPTSWSWSFTPSTITYVGGTNSSSQNPQVQFNADGVYTVSLTATNANGSDTETKLNYITASYYCGAYGGGSFMYISNVQMGTINNSTGQDFYSDFTYLSTDVALNQTGVSITVQNGAVYGGEDLGVWIDWNQDGDFYDTGENIVCEVDDDGQGTFTFDVPGSASLGTTKMRVRIKYFDSDCGDPCGPTTYGEVEDYSVNVIPGIAPPVADFEADNIAPGIGETVNFTDLSTNDPDTWDWTFNPPTVTYMGITNSNSKNPQVQFDAAGYYAVELTATNISGSDTETKIDYINVSVPYIDLDITVFLEGPYNNGSTMNTDLISVLPLDQPFNVEPWFYAGTESVVAIPGTDIVDWALIELRDATAAQFADATSTFDWQAGFIRNDGKIVDLDGNPVLHFGSTVSDSLYVVIHHRNHLSIMTAFGIEENGGIYSYDFSTAAEKAYGSVAQKFIGAGIWGMYGGDGNRDGQVDVLDKSPLWENEVGTNGYLETDYNLNGQSDNQDKNGFWLPNDGQSKQVPD